MIDVTGWDDVTKTWVPGLISSNNIVGIFRCPKSNTVHGPNSDYTNVIYGIQKGNSNINIIVKETISELKERINQCLIFGQ